MSWKASLLLLFIIAIGAQHVGLHAVPQKQLIDMGKLVPPPLKIDKNSRRPKAWV